MLNFIMIFPIFLVKSRKIRKEIEILDTSKNESVGLVGNSIFNIFKTITKKYLGE